MAKLNLQGFYNEHGYTIETVSPLSGILYRAGNHALESTQDGTGTEHQLPLATIERFCLQTGQEMADEQGVKFVGAEYLEEED